MVAQSWIVLGIHVCLSAMYCRRRNWDYIPISRFHYPSIPSDGVQSPTRPCRLQLFTCALPSSPSPLLHSHHPLLLPPPPPLLHHLLYLDGTPRLYCRPALYKQTDIDEQEENEETKTAVKPRLYGRLEGRSCVFIHPPPGSHWRDDLQRVRPGVSICLPFS